LRPSAIAYWHDANGSTRRSSSLVLFLRSFGKAFETADLGQQVLKFEPAIGNEPPERPMRLLCWEMVAVHIGAKSPSTNWFTKPKVKYMKPTGLQFRGSISFKRTRTS
jgi:hypothetical protein